MGWLIALAAGVFLAWLISWIILWNGLPSLQERGAFGDMFGAVNSLFSGLAFAGVVFTIFLQKRELSLQREEMVRSRVESQRMAQSGELSARLSALSQLLAHYEATARILYQAAFLDAPDSNAPGGVRRRTIDQAANIEYDKVSLRHQEFIAELEAVYRQLPPVAAGPAA